jgi:hypothetical protein
VVRSGLIQIAFVRNAGTVQELKLCTLPTFTFSVDLAVRKNLKVDILFAESFKRKSSKKNGFNSDPKGSSHTSVWSRLSEIEKRKLKRLNYST